ncbi:Pet127-domain-containing protein [Thozetella sp. PMI_491]|nr:Pet127-domain-containing protein [Thozetella sp. PMI_491]
MIRLRARTTASIRNHYICVSCVSSLSSRGPQRRPSPAETITRELHPSRSYATLKRWNSIPGLQRLFHDGQADQQPDVDGERYGRAASDQEHDVPSGIEGDGPGETAVEGEKEAAVQKQNVLKASKKELKAAKKAAEKAKFLAKRTAEESTQPEATDNASPDSYELAPESNPTEESKHVPKAAKTLRRQKSKSSGKGKDATKGKREIKIHTIDAESLTLIPVGQRPEAVPRLSYGLDRALFNPGVYHLMDPRSRVYNFDPYLAKIMPLREFDFNSLKEYITSSKDTTLMEKAAKHDKKYAGSTSSMTSTLAHFHFLLSAWRPVNISNLTRNLVPESLNFTSANRAPAASFLHYKDGTYAMDADKEFDTANVLSMLGRSMEKLLTLPKHEYERYRRSNPDQISEQERNRPESYHYTTMGDLMMRSQLDAWDPRIPGTGMFDLKTRAVVAIRMDAKSFQKGLDYEIRHRFGQWESFEREYYDMIRSAFLKYSLQVRMGRMDGIFVAFHNTKRIFGFQYISQAEMDLALHGTEHEIAEREFKFGLHLLNKLLDKATARFPKQSLRLHFETRPAVSPFMYVFAKPVTNDDIKEVQGAGKAAVEEFERTILGLDDKKSAEDSETLSDELWDAELAEAADREEPRSELASEDEQEQDDQATFAAWEDMVEKVEEALDDDEKGIASVREAIEDAMEQVGLLRAYSSGESRRHLDSMLEAITGTSPAVEKLAGQETAIGSSIQADHDEDFDERAEAVAAESTESIEPVEALVNGNDELPASTIPSSHLTESPSLKDLILRVARSPSMTMKTHDSSSGDQSPTVDQTKLQKFGRILSELRAKSQIQDQPYTETQAEEDAEVSSRAAADDAVATSTPSPDSESDSDLLGMVLTIKNRVNGKYVERPENLTSKDAWDVEYTIEEIPRGRAERLYGMMLQRRAKMLQKTSDKAGDESEDTRWRTMFQGNLVTSCDSSRKFREREDAKARTKPVHVFDSPNPLQWDDVFGTPEAPSDESERPEEKV